MATTREKPTYTGAARPASGRDPDVAVVTCALSGVLATRKQCPGIPYTPVEIAEEAKRAYDMGASVVHIHARNVPSIAAYHRAGFRFSHWWADDADPMLSAERQWRVFERLL